MWNILEAYRKGLRAWRQAGAYVKNLWKRSEVEDMAKQDDSVLRAMNIVRDELASVSTIQPNKYNPNVQTEDEFLLLVKSILEDGFTDAVLVNTDRVIIDGEHRWTAAIVLHYLLKNKEKINLDTTSKARARRMEIIDPELKIPIKLLDKDEIQRRISTQRHNKARGHDDVELAAQMFRELEAMGGLDAAMSGLDMTNEEAERLLAYGDSILDHFPGDEPSMAWEPRATVPGQVQSWTDPENNQSQSVSKAASTPVTDLNEDLAPSVPGMSFDPVSNPVKTAPPPRMSRRIFVILEEEAKIVDAALGKDAATTLVQLCKEKLGQ